MSSNSRTALASLLTDCIAISFYPQQTNTFQCVLATDGSGSFLIFLYADLQWALADSLSSGFGSASGSGSDNGSRSASGSGSESGNGSGSGSGTVAASGSNESSEDIPDSLNLAQAGFNAGDGRRFFALPGSGSVDILELNSSSNVGRPGVWIFRVDEAEIIPGGTAICKYHIH